MTKRIRKKNKVGFNVTAVILFVVFCLFIGLFSSFNNGVASNSVLLVSGVMTFMTYIVFKMGF